MKRLALALVVALVGCGGNDAPEAVVGDPSTAPPPFVVTSRAGAQTATQGPGCVDSPDDGGMFGGVCAGGEPVAPEQASVVRPGEMIRIAMPGARLSASFGWLNRLGCRAPMTRFPLRPGETVLRMRVSEGDYELTLSARFTTSDGRTGESTAAAGLRVSADADREIVDLGEGGRGDCA